MVRKLVVLDFFKVDAIWRHVRLELLEGVVAYHSGWLQKSRQSLSSAQAKYIQLQIPDEALSLIMSMGYKERDAKKALRMNNQDVQSAVNFLIEEKEKHKRKKEENLTRQRDLLEQRLYGMTALKKAVNLHCLNELVLVSECLGYLSISDEVLQYASVLLQTFAPPPMQIMWHLNHSEPNHLVWAAATALSKRHAEGTLPVEDFNLELENQSGEKVQLGSDTDQRAIMMGLMLHANGKALIRKQQFKEALEVLTMGEVCRWNLS
ncbi:unnamed protein product [Cuscuta campestris]|uniref:UBA domain-containing protein n=1 Tax=Cuscuta campestris TaxID=132261 RepID=A0A484MHK0_9ASTE|nr:unnamed protein product [Cuscuta campestris]